MALFREDTYIHFATQNVILTFLVGELVLRKIVRISAVAKC